MLLHLNITKEKKMKNQASLRRIGRGKFISSQGGSINWNGLEISSFVRASKILKGEPDGIKYYFPVAGSDVFCGFPSDSRKPSRVVRGPKKLSEACRKAKTTRQGKVHPKGIFVIFKVCPARGPMSRGAS